MPCLLQGRATDTSGQSEVAGSDRGLGTFPARPQELPPDPRGPSLPSHPATSVGRDDLHPAGIGGGLRGGPGTLIPDLGGGSQVGPGHPMFSGSLRGPPGVAAGPGNPGIRFDPIGAPISWLAVIQLGHAEAKQAW